MDKFDSLLFNVAPYQAVLMDPHERVFLELAWEAFEDGGYAKSELKGRKVGVFTGAMWMQYQLYNNSRNVSTSTISSIANRVSYYFGLTGPSLGVDTMCSSSLTALHLACQSVRSGDCTMALAGGSIFPFILINIYCSHKEISLLPTADAAASATAETAMCLQRRQGQS